MNLNWTFIIIILVISITGCKNTPPDGNYCAKVTFKAPDAKKQSSHTFIVEVKKNQLIDISFPEGHYDSSAIKAIDIPIDGKFTAVSLSGQVYKIEMKGPADKCKQATNMVQCKGKSKEGKRCQRYTDNKSGFCWQHKGQKDK